MPRAANSLDASLRSAGTSKREKFVRLAEARTAKAIQAIRVIGKLGNRAAYDFDEADVRKIAAALTKEVDALKARMSAKDGREYIEFKL